MDLPPNIEEVFPVTPLQAGMLFHDLKEPGASVYIQQYAFAVRGRFDMRKLDAAWMLTLQRIPSLRTSFHWEGLSKPLQAVHAKVDYRFHHEDLRALPPDGQEKRLRRFMEEDRAGSFALDRPPLVRLAFHHLKDDHLHMLLTLHHIVADGWSIGVLFEEFCKAYSCGSSTLQTGRGNLPSMRAYVAYLGAKNSETSLRWWAAKLDAAQCPPLPRRKKHPRGDGEEADQSGMPGRLEHSLTEDETALLTRSAAGLGLTLNVFFQAAWAHVLSVNSGRTDVLFASSFALRPAEIPDVEKIFGPLLNVLPIRIVFNGQICRDWLQSIQNDMIEAAEHGHVSVTALRELCTASADGSFINTMTVFENISGQGNGELPFEMTVEESFEKTSYPLTVMGFPEHTLRLVLIYDRRLFSDFDAETMLLQMKEFMLALAHGRDLPLSQITTALSAAPADKAVILAGEEHIFPPFDPWLVFDSLVKRKEDEPALILAADPADKKSGKKRDIIVSYGELHKKADHIAALLHGRGFAAGDKAGIRAVPGADMIAAMLAVWRLNGAWMPLPPIYPERQSARIIEDSGITVLIAGQGLWNDRHMPGSLNSVLFIDGFDSDATDDAGRSLPSHIAADQRDVGCLLYTSGSTGRPKGVCLSHAGLGNRLQWMWKEYPWQKGERACAKTTTAFADFFWEIFGALLAGTPVVIPSADSAKDIASLAELVHEHAVSRLVITPSLLSALVGSGLFGRWMNRLSLLSCSGESLSPRLVESILAQVPEVRLLNLYGSTEVTADATWHEASASGSLGDTVSIGKPIANTLVAVVDENGRPLPRGEEGEILVSGACLATGYRNNEDMTRKCFRKFPALEAFSPGATWFSTGDLAHIGQDGLLYYKGRKDRQVKIRGVRVEPDEVRHILEKHPAVSEAVVYGVLDRTEQKRLVAYIAPDSRRNDHVNAGTSHLEQWKHLYNATYEKIAQKGNFTADYHIWVSSYTGLPLTREEMDECMAETVRSITALNPERILEIGCGQGFLLFPLKAVCRQYTGTDNAPEALLRLSQALEIPWRDGQASTKGVCLYEGHAHDLSMIRDEPYDTAVYNSVVQYFPDRKYLLTALEQAIGKLDHGGRIYLGDLRNYDAEDIFRYSLLIHSHKDQRGTENEFLVTDVLSRTARMKSGEKELLVSPRFFHQLPGSLPRVRAVETMPKRGHADNELTRFRYEAFLYLDTVPLREFCGSSVQWDAARHGRRELARMVRQATQKGMDLCVRRMANARLTPWLRFKMALEDAVASGEMFSSMSMLLQKSEAHEESAGFTREALHDLAQETECEVDIHFASDGLSIDALFRPKGSGKAALPLSGADDRTEGPLSNSPVENRVQISLRTELEKYLEEQLSAPMRPEILLFSKSIPKTLTGKIDVKQLPNPFRQEQDAEGSLPQTSEEKRLAEIWRGLLAVRHVFREDDFFRLGGNSISITQLAFILRGEFGNHVNFRDLYQVPTLRDMAAYLAGNVNPGCVGGLSDAHLNIPEGLPEEDIHMADAAVPASMAAHPLLPGQRILVTGAPGAIGLWVLSHLLERRDCTILCLEEPEGSTGNAGPLECLQQRMRESHCWHSDYARHLRMVPGRLGEERFGLGEAEWARLADNIDLVVHSGLKVNLAQSYRNLRRINAAGTKEVIAFCCAGRCKPLHFISSLSIADHSAREEDSIIREDDDFTSNKGLSSGYILSRWVMDAMVRRAGNRGLPVAIYRFNTVGGDTVSHHCDTTEIYWRLLRVCCQMGLVPESRRLVDIVPVNVAASVVPSIATRAGSYGRAFHICNPRPEPWGCWTDYLNRLGYNVSLVPSSDWVRHLNREAEGSNDDNLRILLSMVRQDGGDSIKPLRIDMSNTLGMAAPKIPPFSFELFTKYHSVMLREGWLPNPGAQ